MVEDNVRNLIQKFVLFELVGACGKETQLELNKTASMIVEVQTTDRSARLALLRVLSTLTGSSVCRLCLNFTIGSIARGFEAMCPPLRARREVLLFKQQILKL